MTAMKTSELVLPGIRAHMGDRIYYLTAMRMSDIAARISSADQILEGTSLDDLLQRRLTDRTAGVGRYLIRQNQRFFNSLVVGSYGGRPNWHEVTVTDVPQSYDGELPAHLEGTIGFLVLNGDEILFAIDGQHRIAGIREALTARPSLGDEEVGVIFVAGITGKSRNEDPEGFRRTRRLFTTLNRYATKVSKSEIIALDEDDPVAIITRDVVQGYPPFVGRISLARGTSLHRRDVQNVTTIVTLYDCLDVFLQRGTGREWEELKRRRPLEEDLREMKDEAWELWDAFVEFFPELRALDSVSGSAGGVGRYRSDGGGHLIFRPVGLLMVVRVVRALMDFMRMTAPQAVAAVSEGPMQLSDNTWVGLLWDSVNRRMMTDKDRQGAAFRFLYHEAGGDLQLAGSSRAEVRRELAGIMNRSEQEILDGWL